ncbi:hypothetical protein [Microbacterium sp.]|uniref:hypothetical protein n=1 Tax=Microbacterium sp. TaxID=51671 RepID=UPI003F96F37C
MRRDRLSRKYPLSGAGGAFDAVWAPSAHLADQAREAEKLTIVPAPTPDGGNGVIDFADGAVTIEV